VQVFKLNREKVYGGGIYEISGEILRLHDSSGDFGWVPDEVAKKFGELLSQYLIEHERPIATVDVNMDPYFVKNKDLYPLQIKIFEKMLFLAQELNLPLNLHSKGAEKLVFDTLPTYNIPNINIHWYSGPESFLKLGIDRGYYFSITPALSYSPAVKKTVSMVDIDHLLLESDGPVKYSGKIGTPAMIKEVLSTISRFKHIPIKELEFKICENTRNIFPKIFED